MIRKIYVNTLLSSLFVLSSPFALARSMPHPSANNPVTQAYMHAMEKMHGPMVQGVTDPDPDVAFVKGMIPHHEGAIDMAQIELKYGKDPEMRKLARDIIEAQKKEVAFMKAWLRKHSN